MKTERLYQKVVSVVLFFLISLSSYAQNKVVAYVPNWIDLNSFSNTIDYAKITHINIAFENPYNAAGDLSFNTANNTLINKAHANNVKVLISIGGGSASGDQVLLARYATLTNNANRAAFVAKLSAYVTAHNFDGLDVDLEGPNINGDYGAFIVALSGALKPKNKLLTSALSQGYGGDKVPSSVFQYFDFVNVMAYDGDGYWDPNAPGQHSSLAFAKSNTQYWINRGLPKEKAVLGVPFYGYGFGSAFRQRDYPYNEVIANYPGAENVDKVGSTIWYNGIPTIKAKTNYAFDLGIGGIMIWSLDYDGTGAKSLLSAIDQVFKARSVVTPPVPQSPYGGIRIALPGKIEVENYDLGGQGVAFNDSETANQGGAYRTDGVDVQATTDAGAGYNVGYIADGEWLEYSVTVGNTAAYNVAFRTASTAGGIVRMEVDGFDVTGSIALPNTAAWQTWATTTKNNVTLTAGQHIVRLLAVTGGFNLNFVTVSETVANVAPSVSLTAPITGASYTSPASIAIAANATDPDGTISKVEFYNGTTLIGTSTTSPYAFTWSNVATGTYTISAKATDNSGAAVSSSIASITVKAPVIVETPFSGTPIALPGTVQAENYNNGGEGLAYHDLEVANQGTAYRLTEGVDVQATTDAGAGYNVGYTADGEWMNYMVNVTTAGSYSVSFRTAGTGTASTIRMEVDGVDVTGIVALPNTGAWQTWATTTVPNIAFSAGAHNIKLFVVTGGFNLNSFTVAVPTQNNMSFLRASGKNIVNNNGNYLIKAVNLGNYMVQEGYMMNLGGGYQWNIKNKIADVVGVASRDQFYKDYLANFITKSDIDSLAKFGFNSVRVPMHYNLFTPLGQPDTYIESGFAYIDNIIGWCKANNMYVILDLHAAPGGQSSGDISDYIAGQPSLWESAANRAQTVKLWRKFAERYVNEPTVGAYDLINETNWTLANNNQLLMQLMKDITASIRQVDNNHLLFIEGNSYANDYNGLTPKWDNNMAYSFHKYWNDPSQGSINFVLNIRDSQNVPIWLGEFGENSNHWIAESVTIMNNNNIGWAIWPYKKMSSVSSIGSFKQPNNWTALANYINGGAKPSAAVGQAILNELVQNVKTQNLTFNKGYVYALIKQPNNNNTTPFMTLTLPGKVLAAHYDEGKNGYAFSDANFQNTQYGNPVGSSTSWNNGWYYRNDGVDLQFSAPENGPTIGYTENNEWLQYTVNVTTTGSYTVKLRAAGNGGNISVSVDGTTIINNASVAATGGWDVWQTITLGNMNLSAGKHTLRATMTTAGYNLSYFDFSTTAVANQAPTVSLTSPANGSSSVAPVSIVIIANAADADGTVSKVDFYNGTALLGTDATAPYSYTWSVTAAGTYAITAKATDNAGAVTTSTGVSVTVTTNTTTPINQVPTVSLTSPANGSSSVTPASIVITANAADADGTVSKVDFYNGTTLLGTDATSPYAYTWTNVVVGTYTITAKATDNAGAVTTSSSVSVTVTAVVTNKCSTIAQYVENAGYVAGSKVKNANSQYQCKPYPYSGWCNGAAWAYGPGTGAYWSDAWTLVGTCSGARSANDIATVNETLVTNAPNPFAGSTNIEVVVSEAGDVSVKVYDKTGQVVGTVVEAYLTAGTYTYSFDAANLKADMYLVKMNTSTQVITRKIVKAE